MLPSQSVAMPSPLMNEGRLFDGLPVASMSQAPPLTT
jgi:hypothetical protein